LSQRTAGAEGSVRNASTWPKHQVDLFAIDGGISAASSASGSPGIAEPFAAKMSAEDEVYAFVKGSSDAKSLLSGIKLSGDSGGVVLRNDAEVSSAKDLVGFDVDGFFSALSTDGLGRTLLASKRLPSTHTLVSKSFASLPIGTVCISRIQYSGRGRGGNTWESPDGCLMFSLSLRWTDGRSLPLLQYVLSLAVVQAIEEMARERGTSLPQVALKWPNDIFLGGQKVGGVLCTSSYRSKAFDVTVGIGLNVDNTHPTTCINAALQAACPSAAPVSHEALLAAVLNRLHSLLTVFEREGFKPLEADYLHCWLHSGQQVVLEEAQAGGGVTQVSLTIQGLTSGGYLLATDPSGVQFELSPDGNSLDFFKGLMRRKLDPQEQVVGGR
ncbi:hypothetical protein CLOM_g19358, partial [Closterium sp. NIES-68]